MVKGRIELGVVPINLNSEAQMNCIKIFTPPQGGEVSDKIRAAWIGLVLPIKVEYEPFSRGQLSERSLELLDVAMFPVDMQLAIEILGLHRPEAAKWWRENRNNITSTAFFSFNPGCCEVVEGIPSVTAVKRLNTEVTLKEFIRTVSDVESSVFFDSRLVEELFRPEHREEFEQSALTAPAVLLLAKEVAKECAFGITGASTRDYMDHISDEGHSVLRTAHRIAEQSGIKIALELIDQPLSMVEAAERAGLIQIVDGYVHLADQEQLPLI